MDVITKTVDKALLLLNACKAKYIIVLPDGTTHEAGGLKLHVEPDPKKRVQRVPMGFYKPMYQDSMDRMVVGDVWSTTVDLIIDIDGLRGAAGAYGVKKWGNGSVVTTINRDKRTVEILRVI